MGGVTRIFQAPKPDPGATMLQQQQLEAQTRAVDEQRQQMAQRDAEVQRQEAARAATARARRGGGRRSLLLNDEIGVPPMQQRLGG